MIPRKEFGLTIYPPSPHPGWHRVIGPYQHRTKIGAKLHARIVSLGFPLDGDETEPTNRPRVRDRFVAVEGDLERYDEVARYHRGRRIA